MTDLLQRYATRLQDIFEQPAQGWTKDGLNGCVLRLPFAETHIAASGRAAKYLPRLGEDVALDEHIKQSFFGVLNNPAIPLIVLTEPVLVARRWLAALEHWQDWKTLRAFMLNLGLDPCMVFRNTPLQREGSDYYVADCRMLFTRAP